MQNRLSLVGIKTQAGLQSDASHPRIMRFFYPMLYASLRIGLQYCHCAPSPESSDASLPCLQPLRRPQLCLVMKLGMPQAGSFLGARGVIGPGLPERWHGKFFSAVACHLTMFAKTSLSALSGCLEPETCMFNKGSFTWARLIWSLRRSLNVRLICDGAGIGEAQGTPETLPRALDTPRPCYPDPRHQPGQSSYACRSVSFSGPFANW